MQSGCTLVCCPNCGYQTVNVGRSKFARLASLLLSTKSREKYPSERDNEDCLAEVPVGKKAKVIGFTADFPLDKRSYLQAYGLVPNYLVEILAHSPVTIVRLDNSELALENDLARGIIVEWRSRSES